MNSKLYCTVVFCLFFVCFVFCCILNTVMCVLTILAWNARGMMSSTLCLTKLLESSNCDICVVGEHKLMPSSLSFFDYVDTSYSSVAKTDELSNDYKA